jgi:hypothetical protein
MKAIALIIMGAVLVEALIEYFKTIWNMIEVREYKTAVTQLISILLGIFIAQSFELQLFNHVVADLYGGFSLSPIKDMILTGILISRGSNYASDIISRLTKKENLLGQLMAIQADGFGFEDDDEYEDEEDDFFADDDDEYEDDDEQAADEEEGDDDGITDDGEA